jgi:2-polyprenyl-3-methyl-5-hydroxy-6-metoxy-1,4-benzoquinol methylase
MICPLCSENIIKVEVLSNDKWKIFCCPVCTNAWTFPDPLSIEYSIDNFHGEKKKEDLPWEWKKSLKMQESLIKKYLDINKKILEIGCGSGFLLQSLHDYGYNVSGIEPSFKAVELARNKGLNVYCDIFPSKLLKDKKFDLIIMSHVLEHIKDTTEIINEVKNHLNPGGLFLLIQTNYEGIVPRLKKDNWYAWVPEQHYWHFTPKGLTKLLEKEEFKVLKTEYSTIVHGNMLSFIYMIIPKTGDQFHLLARV